MNLGVIPDILQFVRGKDFAIALQFLQTSGYGIMFLLMLLEGPIVAYIAAFSSSLGIFNIYYVFLLSFLGNQVGDLIFFFIGRVGKEKTIEEYEHRKLNETKLNKLKRYLERNPGKTIATIKLTPFLPIPGLILAGASKMKLKVFVFYSIVINLAYSSCMIFLGFYSGVAFLTMAKYIKYAEYVLGGTILLLIAIFFLVKLLSKKISNKMEQI